MKKEDIKDKVDEMLVQIVKYIKACDLSDKEDCEIKLESALSLLISAIDFTDNPNDNIDYIVDQVAEIQTNFILATTEAVTSIVKGDLPAKRWKI